MLLPAFTSICHPLPWVLFQNAIQIMSPPSSKASLVAQTVKNLPAMQETLVWSLGWEDAMEKRMATHSSILAWRIPQTEEPAGLQSIWVQSVRADWMTNTFLQSCHQLPITSSRKFEIVCYALSGPPPASLAFTLTANSLSICFALHPSRCSMFCLSSYLLIYFLLLSLLLSPGLPFLLLFLLLSSSGLPFLFHFPLSKSYSGTFLVVQMIKNLPTMQEIWVWSLSQEGCLEKGIPTPVFLPREPCGQRSLVGSSPWGCRVVHNWSNFTHKIYSSFKTPLKHFSPPRTSYWKLSPPYNIAKCWSWLDTHFSSPRLKAPEIQGLCH